MNKIFKRIIVVLIIVFILGGLAIFKMTAERNAIVPDNPSDAIGNTAGNLYNGGYFTEGNGLVFFVNPFDDDAVYAMNPDGSNVHKLASSNASYLNYYNGYIYFYSLSSSGQTGLGYVSGNRGLFRVDENGKKCVTLHQLTSDSCMLLGSRLYYTVFEEGPKDDGNARIAVRSITINGEDEIECMVSHIRLGSTYNGQILYGGDREHSLYLYNSENKTETTLLSGTVYLPIYYNGSIYYLDVTDDYKLKAYNLSDESITTIVDERVDTYNLYDGIIYYQNVDPDGYALRRVYTDGTGLETVRDGVHKDINITSNYVYFREFGNDVPIYKTPTFGAINVVPFSEAMNISMAN